MKSKEQEGLDGLRKIAKDSGIFPVKTSGGNGDLKVLTEVLHKLGAKEYILKPDSKGGMTTHIVFKPNYSEHCMYVDEKGDLFFRGSEKDASNSDAVCNKILMALVSNLKQEERRLTAERNVCHSAVESYRNSCGSKLEQRVEDYLNMKV